jgi:ribosomal protein S18 acetylase RimI-like enzyme
MNYKLIPAMQTDEDWLEDLRRDVYQGLFQATWGGWDEDRHKRHFAECIARGNISIIDVNGMRVGMIQLINEPDAVEICEIQVQPSHQNQGIGTTVLKDVIAEAHQLKRNVRLRVGLKNDQAYRLYERLGFRLVARTETHHHMTCEPLE